MISLGIIFILAKYNVLNCAVGPVENEDLFYQAWNGVVCSYGAVEDMSYVKGTLSNVSSCHLFREDPAVTENLSARILIAKAQSDNTDLFRNFADTVCDKIQAIPLQDEVYIQPFHSTLGHMSSTLPRARRECVLW
jgi:hypothetical protein